jgi:hypothetical protein
MSDKKWKKLTSDPGVEDRSGPVLLRTLKTTSAQAKPAADQAVPSRGVKHRRG